MASNQGRLLKIINDVTLGVSIPGVVVSVLLLVAFTYLRWNTVSAPHLDRVSFRLLVYALVANIVFGTMMLPNMKEQDPACSLVAFLGVTAPMLSACMFCCMALNLQLVLVYGVNGARMEKFYITGSLLLCGICNGTTWVAGELGWFASNGACWLKDPTPDIQLRWLVATQSVWMVLMSTIEVISFLTILIFMCQQEMRVQRLRADSLARSTTTSQVSLQSPWSQPPIVRYRPMIIRIGLYPLLSCFLSVTACILDVYTVTHPGLTDFDVNLRIVNLFVYSLRPLLYALLAATDPSFLRALRSLRPTDHHKRKLLSWRQTQQTATSDSSQTPSHFDPGKMDAESWITTPTNESWMPRTNENCQPTSIPSGGMMALGEEGGRPRPSSAEEQAEQMIGRQI
ncbi:hypothetical protein C8R43DRAFT_1195166 [Mycena crocata]|nr:hypothetical protein C8R43DRAFT_1195166 [Mycena crocata]